MTNLKMYLAVLIVANCLVFNTLVIAGLIPNTENNQTSDDFDSNVLFEIDREVERLKTLVELAPFFKNAYGFAVFPKIAKVGLFFGGAYGSGMVFEQHVKQPILIGKSKLSQFSLGFQLGWQSFSQIIFFRSKTELDYFCKNNFEFNAQASAIVSTFGAAANYDYSDGVAVFTFSKTGLMYSAEIGGQLFDFESVNIAALLEKADHAFKENRLITLTGTGALDYYQLALRLQPDNNQSLSGVKNVAKQLFKQMLIAVSQNDLTKATALRKQAIALGIDENELVKELRYEEKLQKTKQK